MLSRRAELRAADVLVLSKIKLSAVEATLLRRLTRRVVFDLDDAIYFRKPRRLGKAPGRSWLRQAKFDATCRVADLVIAGNRTLADRARISARRVEILPTSVDLEPYRLAPCARRNGRSLVWIGLPENLVYLELVRPVLAELAAHHPEMRLRVVSSCVPDWPDVPVDHVPWSAETEADALMAAGIGLMPLTDDDWTRGKCAFKLLQYMAAGLPCVASAVGANNDVVTDGETGFLARTPEQWRKALDALLTDRTLRSSMGASGRRRVQAHYDRQVIGHRLVRTLVELSGTGRGTPEDIGG